MSTQVGNVIYLNYLIKIKAPIGRMVFLHTTIGYIQNSTFLKMNIPTSTISIGTCYVTINKFGKTVFSKDIGSDFNK